MVGLIKKILGIGPKVDLGAVIIGGAMVIDVRTAAEYSDGHVRGSVNIPLDSLANRMPEVRKDIPIITCCASGMRSRSARSMLLANGFTEVYNAGAWQNLKKFEK